MIYLLQLSELNIKQAEYWLRSLQTTYSFSFRYLKRTLCHSLNIYYNRKLVLFRDMHCKSSADNAFTVSK